MERDKFVLKRRGARVTRKHWPPVHGPPTDLVHGPLQGPVRTGPRTLYGPPLQTPHEKTITTMTTYRDLTYLCFLFFFSPWRNFDCWLPSLWTASGMSLKVTWFNFRYFPLSINHWTKVVLMKYLATKHITVKHRDFYISLMTWTSFFVEGALYCET